MTIQVDESFKEWFWNHKFRPIYPRNGIKHSSTGYILIHKPDHPNRNNHGYVFEHRLVMEKILGRYLTRQEQVHHINGNRKDNRPENLMLFQSKNDHARYHQELLRNHNVL